MQKEHSDQIYLPGEDRNEGGKELIREKNGKPVEDETKSYNLESVSIFTMQEMMEGVL